MDLISTQQTLSLTTVSAIYTQSISTCGYPDESEHSRRKLLKEDGSAGGKSVFRIKETVAIVSEEFGAFRNVHYAGPPTEADYRVYKDG